MCLVLSCLCANFAFALDKSKDCKCRVSAAKRIVNGELADYNYHVISMNIMRYSHEF